VEPGADGREMKCPKCGWFSLRGTEEVRCQTCGYQLSPREATKYRLYQLLKAEGKADRKKTLGLGARA
jgi:DNA-directed RNA polymerase subunit RPC12/RpoP